MDSSLSFMGSHGNVSNKGKEVLVENSTMGSHGNASNKGKEVLIENSNTLFSDLDLPPLSSSMNTTPWFDENASIFAHESQMGHSSLMPNQQLNTGSPLFTSSNGYNSSIFMGKNQVNNVSNSSNSPSFGMNYSFSNNFPTQVLRPYEHDTLFGQNGYNLPMRSHSSHLANFNRPPLLFAGSTSTRKSQAQTHFPPPTFASNPNSSGSKRSLSIANHSSNTYIPFLSPSSTSFIQNPPRNQLGFAPNIPFSTIENSHSKYKMPMRTSPSHIDFESNYQCLLCPKVFPSRIALGGHMSSHTKEISKDMLIGDKLKKKLENMDFIPYRRGLALTLTDGKFSVEVYTSEFSNKKMKYSEERGEMSTVNGASNEEILMLPNEIGKENLFEQSSALFNHGYKENLSLQQLEDPPKENHNGDDENLEDYLVENGEETVPENCKKDFGHKNR